MSLTFALIGCGNIGKRHAEHIQVVGKLVAVCDIIKPKADELAKKYKTSAYCSVEDLFFEMKNIYFFM